MLANTGDFCWIYSTLIKNCHSQIYEGNTAAAITIMNHESQSPVFMVSSPLLRLEGTLTKLTLFIEYLCFGALVRSHRSGPRADRTAGQRQ